MSDDPDSTAAAAAAQEYHRGVSDTIQAEHTRRLAKINGSIDRFADLVHGLDTSIQNLQGLFEAAELTRVATAKALKEQTDTRRDESSDNWTPWSRVVAIVSVLIAIGSVAFAIITHH